MRRSPTRRSSAASMRSDGVQLKWVAPTDLFLELGAEIGNGDAFPGSDRNRNGIGAASVFVHAGGDIGASHSWRAGLSYLDARADGRETTQFDARRATSRRPASAARARLADRRLRLEVRAERQRAADELQAAGRILLAPRERRPDLRRRRRARPHADGARIHRAQSGWYLQGVYQFMPPGASARATTGSIPGTPDYGANDPLLAVRRLPSAARHGDGRLDAVGVQPPAAAVRAEPRCGPT